MSSRFWFALLFVAAFGPQPRPGGRRPNVLKITVDEAKVAEVPHGNVDPHHRQSDDRRRDAAEGQRRMVLTGKGYGQTNLIALNSEGKVLLEEQLRVLPPGTVLVFQNGTSRISYSCNPVCMPMVQLGDDNDVFSKAGSQITLHDSLAAGTNPSK